MDSKLTIELI